MGRFVTGAPTGRRKPKIHAPTGERALMRAAANTPRGALVWIARKRCNSEKSGSWGARCGRGVGAYDELGELDKNG